MEGLGQSIHDNAVKEERIERIQMLLQKGFDKDFILDVGYTEEEYTEAKQELSRTI